MIRAWEIVDKAVKEVKKRNKDIILDYKTRNSGESDTLCIFKIRKYEREKEVDILMSEIIRTAYPHKFLQEKLDKAIREVK